MVGTEIGKCQFQNLQVRFGIGLFEPTDFEAWEMYTTNPDQWGNLWLLPDMFLVWDKVIP